MACTGVFYPLKHSQRFLGTTDKFDELTYYAERFDRLINNTFYRPPAVKTAQSRGG
jgi:uncharacterized protein YecE (DUF72 family)